ncbi:MAG: conserved hypothetical rane protein [Acidobacteriales bacterium]|nr:conserved hypothetical rane protein [Terriglobales bacterium]
MKVAKTIFNVAGIYGIVVLLPHYFMEEAIGRAQPPAITHPEFFYGFVGVGLAWQFAFLVIAQNPIRYRLLMLPAIFEKWGFVAASGTLIAMHRVAPSFAVPVAIDFILGSLFLWAFLKTPQEQNP